MNYFRLLKWINSIMRLPGLLLNTSVVFHWAQTQDCSWACSSQRALQSSHGTAQSFTFRQVLSFLQQDPSGIVISQRREQRIGLGRSLGTCAAASFLPRFPKDLGQEGNGPGDLVSSKSMQHSLAMSRAVQHMVVLSEKDGFYKEIVASAALQHYWEECDLWQTEGFIIKTGFDSVFPCRSLFLVVPIFVWAYLCLFSKTTHSGTAAVCSACIHQEERLEGKALEKESWDPSPSVQSQFPCAGPSSMSCAVPDPSCCLRLNPWQLRALTCVYHFVPFLDLEQVVGEDLILQSTELVRHPGCKALHWQRVVTTGTELPPGEVLMWTIPHQYSDRFACLYLILFYFLLGV